MKLAPIILFIYNRPAHTRATLDALRANVLASDSDLFIYSDGAKNHEQAEEIEALRSAVSKTEGFKSVHVVGRDRNYGLARNIIEGTTELVNRYGKVIVLEDDLITSPYFLQFMNDALNLYEKNDQVISIAGYCYPTDTTLPESFFLRGADCWGWATWKRGWDLFNSDGKQLLQELTNTNQLHEFDFNGAYPFSKMLEDQIRQRNNSWAIRWYASAFLKKKYTLYPGKSLVYNDGADGSGTHMQVDDMFRVELSQTRIDVQPIPVKQCEEAFEAFGRFHYQQNNPSLLYRIKRYLKNRKIFSK